MAIFGRVVVLSLAAAFVYAYAQVTVESLKKKPQDARVPRLQAESNLVLVPVSVVDARNHPITGLKRENFRVFDDDIERQISTFSMDDEPVAVGLVLDHSNSVKGLRQSEAETIHLFLKTSNPEDDYFLVEFADRPKLVVPLSNGDDGVGYRVLTTKWGGSTALLDAVALGVNELKKSQLRRKALLVISDGGENHSRYNQGDLRSVLEEADAAIYAVGFNSYQANFGLLKWMAEMTGGLAILARSENLPDIAAKIALELRNRYVLGFVANDIPQDNKAHSLRVELVTSPRAPALKAAWRRYYHAPEN